MKPTIQGELPPLKPITTELVKAPNQEAEQAWLKSISNKNTKTQNSNANS